jgi:hypothetical protein
VIGLNVTGQVIWRDYLIKLMNVFETDRNMLMWR